MTFLAPYWHTFITGPITAGIELFAQYLHSYALAIIAFTIFVKLLLLPLTLKATRSQKAMQAVGPAIAEMKKKHPNDRAMQSQETMRIYSEYGVNPAGGCLPMIIQFPILIGLYQSLINPPIKDHLNEPFLWVKTLALPDTWFAHSALIAHNGLFILPILAGVGQFVQQRMMMSPTTDPQQKLMNQMMQFMPLMIVYFGIKFPAGLAVYWVTSTSFAIVQQYFITGWGQLLPGTRFSSPPRLFTPKHAPKATASPESAEGVIVPPAETSSTEAQPTSDRQTKHRPQTTRPKLAAPRTALPQRRQGGKR